MASVIVRSELSRYINIELVALNGLFPVLWLNVCTPLLIRMEYLDPLAQAHQNSRLHLIGPENQQ